VDALGSLIRFVLLPGQRHDMVGVAPLIRDLCFDALLADKAFDADWLRTELNQRGATAVIPPKANRKQLRRKPQPRGDHHCHAMIVNRP
jgi:transposase